MNILNSAFRKVFQQWLPTKELDVFQQQKDFLSILGDRYSASPLYTNAQIKQEDINSFNTNDLKNYLAQYGIIEYKTHIYPLVEQWIGITEISADLHIKTSGTSDAFQWGKLIPTQWHSLKSERFAIEKTLYHYLWEYPKSKIFYPYSFSLTAPFDTTERRWYISGAMRFNSPLVGWMMFPSSKILAIADYSDKKEMILQELLERAPTLRSFHGVPARPLWFIDELIARDAQKAKQILSHIEYVSIGWWTPQDNKQQYQSRLEYLWINKKIAWSNNHNASGWFFGSQIRNFGDLAFQRMSPLYEINFFLFVPSDSYKKRKFWQITSSELIGESDLLHEVKDGVEYFMLFANDRIPRLYDIKDKVVFFDTPEWSVKEYEVIGRYSMSSNLMNEHIESDIIETVLEQLSTEWYNLDKTKFVAWLELNLLKTSGIFHIIIEWKLLSWVDFESFRDRFDILMGEHNNQWKIFREKNERITACHLVVRAPWFILSTMMKLWLAHEQSKIPHLSDNNYVAIVKPLLDY